MAKVLIIEDDTLLAQALSNKLQLKGYEVDIASDGEEGINKAKTFLPEVILLDVLMPKINGIEVYKKISEDVTLKNTKVAVITNLADPQTRNEFKNLGVEEYLVKTDYTASGIVKLVDKLIKT